MFTGRFSSCSPDAAAVALLWIRLHALALALPLAQQAPGLPLAGQVWPYVSTCWRLLDDPRAAWLDGDPAFVRSVAVGLSTRELAQLADLLRGLHRAQLPYPEQSVRGGTQTDRSVLLRHEPLLVRTREALLRAHVDVEVHAAIHGRVRRN